MDNEAKAVMLLGGAIMCFFSAVILLLAALWQLWLRARDRRRCTGQATGYVVGEVELAGSDTRTAGEVPPLALTAWTRNSGLAFHGGDEVPGALNGTFLYLWISLLRGLSPWRFYPCVVFQAEEGERTAVSLTGTRREFLPIGRDVTVWYDPAKSGRFYIEEAGRGRPPLCFWAALLFAAAGLCLLFL